MVAKLHDRLLRWMHGSAARVPDTAAAPATRCMALASCFSVVSIGRLSELPDQSSTTRLYKNHIIGRGWIYHGMLPRIRLDNRTDQGRVVQSVQPHGVCACHRQVLSLEDQPV